MKIFENNCCDCKAIGLQCNGSNCPNNKVYEKHICDVCGEEIEENDLEFEVDGKEVCQACFKENAGWFK